MSTTERIHLRLENLWSLELAFSPLNLEENMQL